MLDKATTALEVLGFLCLVAAAFTVDVTVGLAAAGASCLTLGFLFGRG